MGIQTDSNGGREKPPITLFIHMCIQLQFSFSYKNIYIFPTVMLNIREYNVQHCLVFFTVPCGFSNNIILE